MRKIYFLFIGFLPFFGFSQSSTAKIDSLQRLVKKGHNERNFQRILNLAELYSDSDLKTAQKFAKANTENVVTPKKKGTPVTILKIPKTMAITPKIRVYFFACF